MSYSGYVINGHHFHTRDVNKSTQDSGVSMDADIGKITYYGVIRDIVLLDYRMFEVPIFDCDWANITNGVKVGDGFTLLNLHQGLHQFRKDPFILASQAKEVFYSRTDSNSNWYVGSKRAKIQHVVVLAAAILQARQRRAIRISDGVAAANPTTEGINVSSKGKGKTLGENAAKFASLLGATARELVPITLENWKDISEDFKHQLWEHAQNKFIVDECHKKYALQKMAKLLQDHRCKLLKEVRKRGELVGIKRATRQLNPDNIKSMEEWQSFIKKRLSPKYKEISERFKKMRAM
ncbi:PREDICTED: transposon CACTA En/Spm [Prunus dulcis]|uniref:PREDICTED: transposon CACTA En/Spm n=1 Tax=Prunus dulcis TaxID=3755 RepID=A0A5E4FS54_PRUDU|nr:hypothetical protein L3X38_003944 [Prunus dulcis]VVA30336.1 PREDICTED: transposon CACTA En/Spm [Prunus dulcis]